MYPEHNKINTDELKGITSFLEFMEENGLQVVKMENVTYHTGNIQTPNKESLIYKYFGVDQVKLEEEKRQMLEKLRK